MTNKSRSARRRSTRRGSTPFWQSPAAWVLALLVVALIVTIALAAGDDSPEVSAHDETGPVEIIGPPLAPFSTPDTAIGSTVPTVSAQTFAGDRVQVDADGTARLFGFFAHWCPHCQAELPRTAAWLSAHEPTAGIEVIAVSTLVDSSAANYPPSAWFEREDWPGQVLIDDEDSSLASAFGLVQVPYWVGVDADGTVVVRRSGELGDNELEDLLSLLTPAA